MAAKRQPYTNDEVEAVFFTGAARRQPVTETTETPRAAPGTDKDTDKGTDKGTGKDTDKGTYKGTDKGTDKGTYKDTGAARWGMGAREKRSARFELKIEPSTLNRVKELARNAGTSANDVIINMVNHCLNAENRERDGA